MEIKMGRPTKAKKNLIIKARIDDQTNEKLEKCVNKTGKSKSDIVRDGILKIYQELEGEQK